MDKVIYKNLTEEEKKDRLKQQKKDYYLKNKEVIKQRVKDKYNTDEEFRLKHIEKMKLYRKEQLKIFKELKAQAIHKTI
jgi:hypothetical protein